MVNRTYAKGKSQYFTAYLNAPYHLYKMCEKENRSQVSLVIYGSRMVTKETTCSILLLSWIRANLSPSSFFKYLAIAPSLLPLQTLNDICLEVQNLLLFQISKLCEIWECLSALMRLRQQAFFSMQIQSLQERLGELNYFWAKSLRTSFRIMHILYCGNGVLF